jgi:hypothetical protein
LRPRRGNFSTSSPPASSENFTGNLDRFTGFADLYDRVCASPPAALADVAAQYLGAVRPARMQASGSFRYVREPVIHHEDSGDAERLVGLLLSQGRVMGRLKRSLAGAAIGIDTLRVVAARSLGAGPRRWRWSARVRLGVV